MTRIAIIAAMAGELKPFLDANAKEGWVYERRGNVRLWRLIWPDDQGEWVAACAGAGEQAAMRAFAEVEKDGPISSVISIGWVGALSATYAPGRAYRVSGVIDSRTGERFQASAATAELLLVTSPKVADAPEKQRLASAYNAGLVDMEAAAVARLAAMRGIPFRCIKGVSDGFTENLPDFNRFISPQGQFQMVRLLLFVLPRPWHWPALVRMGENSRKASQAIRDLLLENLDKPGAIANQNGDSNLTC
jgi:adenosylhomocysteine nucleosidase